MTKDVSIFLILLLLGFPLGVGLAVFLRWLSRQKRDARSQQAVGAAWVGPIGGVGANGVMALLNAFQHNAHAVQTNLVEAAIFTSMLFGDWTEAKRFQKRRSASATPAP